MKYTKHKTMKNLKLITVLFILFFSTTLFSQIVIDFEDNDISGWEQSINNHWEIINDDSINISSLHHSFDSPSSSEDMISYNLNNLQFGSDTINWRFKIKYSYGNASAGNNWSVFLSADTNSVFMHPDSSINGYVFGVNYEGSTDNIQLLKINNGNATPVIDASFNWDDSITDDKNKTTIAFEILRYPDASWQIFIDEVGDFASLIKIGEGTDNSFSEAKYFGVYYSYSAAQDQKLWLDDIYIGKRIKDTVAPIIDIVKIISNNELQIIFNEELENTSAIKQENYTLNNFTISGIVLNSDKKSVNISFNESFQDEITNEITMKNIEDTEGNKLKETTKHFTYYRIKVADIYTIDKNNIRINFTKDINPASINFAGNYSVDGLSFASATLFSSNSITVNFSNDIIENQFYYILLSNIEDEYANKIKDTTLSFGIFTLDSLDIVINEVVFNPVTNGNDFVELYNKSDKILNLNDLQIAKRDNDNNLDSEKELTDEDILIYPNEFIVLTKDTEHEQFLTYKTNFDALMELSLPSYSSDEGTVVLLSNSQIIDEFHYNEDMHFALLQVSESDDFDGVSLERVNPNRCTKEWANWHSAAENTGFGTPGYQNSQYSENYNSSSGDITVFPEIFSPDNDGFDDILNISYKFSTPGKTANIKVFNAKGQIVKNFPAKYLGTEGSFKWDGTTDDRIKAKIGVYIIFVEVFNEKGKVERYKKSCVLATKK